MFQSKIMGAWRAILKAYKFTILEKTSRAIFRAFGTFDSSIKLHHIELSNTSLAVELGGAFSTVWDAWGACFSCQVKKIVIKLTA